MQKDRGLKQAKRIKSEIAAGNRFFKSAPERVLPVVYEGKIIRIREDGVALDWSKLPYESKHHINVALKAGDILEVKGE